LLVILSENSLASDWVEDEVSKAYAEERRRREAVLVPVRIDNAVMATSEAWAVKLRDQRNIGDFTRWKDPNAYQQSFDRLVRDLRMAAKGGATPGVMVSGELQALLSKPATFPEMPYTNNRSNFLVF
jgi:hypothetical protein